MTVRRTLQPGDLRLLQDALQAAPGDRLLHVGDLAWRSRDRGDDSLHEDLVAWWQGDTAVGWVWVRPRGGFDVVDLTAEQSLTDLLWAAVDEAGPRAAYTFPDVADTVATTHLRERGFLPEGGAHDVLRLDVTSTGTVDPDLPGGMRVVPVDDDLVDARVHVQRRAFGVPSTFHRVQFERVRARWPYRTAHDLLVLDGDEPVAFGTGWLDDHGRGLLEPIGVVPTHQGRGLGVAVTAAITDRLAVDGARTVQAGTSGEAAEATYRRIGFTAWRQEQTWRRPAE